LNPCFLLLGLLTAFRCKSLQLISFLRYDVHERHYVSANCYVSMEPEWLGMAYWVNDTRLSVLDIPYGYKMNQFTINPEGTLK